MYEVDIAIERNAQTIKHLQPIAEEMNKLKSAEEKAGQPIGRLQYKLKPRALNSVHIGAIARIYGDSGDEVIQHLIRNPLMVVPLIYQRMVEKDKEWRKAREELMKGWKEEIKKHHRMSLDGQLYFYKTKLMKSLADESLIEVWRFLSLIVGNDARSLTLLHLILLGSTIHRSVREQSNRCQWTFNSFSFTNYPIRRCQYINHISHLPYTPVGTLRISTIFYHLPSPRIHIIAFGITF